MLSIFHVPSFYYTALCWFQVVFPQIAVWKLTGICTVFHVILLFQTHSNTQSEVDRQETPFYHFLRVKLIIT